MTDETTDDTEDINRLIRRLNTGRSGDEGEVERVPETGLRGSDLPLGG